MKTKSLLSVIPQPAVCLIALGLATSLAGIGLAHGQGNPNPGAVPRQAEAYGKTYEEWIAAYRQWHTGIPAARNPVLDNAGDFCGEEQSGPVWFLPHSLAPGTVERECHVPAGKALFVHMTGILAWLDGPADREAYSWVAETFLGLDPTTLSDEDLISVFANWVNDSVTYLSLTVDGVVYTNLFSYRVLSPIFDMIDTDLYDDLGVPYRHPNLSIAGGYVVILNPLANGPHTIEVQTQWDNPLFGQPSSHVTYHVWVGK